MQNYHILRVQNLENVKSNKLVDQISLKRLKLLFWHIKKWTQVGVRGRFGANLG